MALQNHRAERRCQGQCHKGGKRHGHRNGQSELTVKNTRHAAQERNRYEHGSQNEGDSHNRALHFGHGALGGINRR